MPDRLKIVTDFFLDFNRDPYKNKALVEHYVERLWDCDERILNLACKELSMASDTLPKWRDILASYRKIKAFRDVSVNDERYDCNICGGSGAIKSVFCGNIELYSLNFESEGAMYYSKIIGKCECPAGNKMPASLPIKSAPKFVYSFAQSKDWDCNFAAERIVIMKNNG